MLRFMMSWGWMACLLLIVGCGQGKSPEEEGLDTPAWLVDGNETSEKHTGPNPKPGSKVAEEAPSRTRDPAEPHGELKLQLQPGTMFPLKKQILTTLDQAASDGTKQRIETELKLQMAIKVEQVAEGSTLLSVRYRRIEFQQSMNGKTFVYQSNNPPAEIPIAARAYQDRKSTRLNSSHGGISRMPSSA